jgi:hypothetical protein
MNIFLHRRVQCAWACIPVAAELKTQFKYHIHVCQFPSFTAATFDLKTVETNPGECILDCNIRDRGLLRCKTYGQKGRQEDGQRGGKADGQEVDWQMKRKVDWQMEGKVNGKMGRQVDRHVDMQMDKEVERCTRRWTEMWTGRWKEMWTGRWA